MHKNESQTIDLFAAPESRVPAGRDWPNPARFPLNQGRATVEDVVLKDLRDSANPLIVTGFSSLDNLVEFIASAEKCKRIRVVFGSEPFESRRQAFPLRGRDLPEEMKEYWVARGISILLSGKILICLDRLETGALQTRYVRRAHSRLHAKIYVGDEAATVGSSNFTKTGLQTQLEANVRFERNARRNKAAKEEERHRYEETVQIAEQFWELGEDYNSQLKSLLKELLRLVSWEEAVARAANELLEGSWAKQFLRAEYLPGDAPLWPSQRLGIAQALYILRERGSVLIADATGSGKTRMGTHLVGAKIHEIISSNRLRQGKALLVCPPSVTSEWQQESALAGVHIDVFSHGSLSHTRAHQRDNVVTNLRRAQILCVDEGHNFLNFASNRTQELLRNMADHTILFTATPINKSASDLLRIADMLGADNLDESTISAFGKMLAARKLSRVLSEEEIADLRQEIGKFTLRRTKRALNELIDRAPHEYLDASGRQCRFPEHRPRTYELREPDTDREKAARVRELAGQLLGVLHFRKDISLPNSLRRRGITERQYLEGRLRGASKLSQYAVMSALRSSRAALIEHLLGTRHAVDYFNLPQHTKRAGTGNLIGRLIKAAGKTPRNRLGIAVPNWLADPDEHRGAAERETEIYREIVSLASEISDGRERAKAALLAELAQRFSHILAFDSRPITLALLRMLLDSREANTRVLVATGVVQSDRADVLAYFSPKSEDKEPTIGLCSDSVSEGVNLQRAQAVVHLDMPSVVRIAEQRVGRIDRLDSPHKEIYAFWPDDADEFALRSDERFIERYETVENLLGSNMPLPEGVRGKPRVFRANDAIEDFAENAEKWDGIDDAFSPVRALVAGRNALVSPATFKAYKGIKAHVLSRVSLVSAVEPWAFFCMKDESGVPKWVFLADVQAEPTTDLRSICDCLRERLGPEVLDLDTFTAKEQLVLDTFLRRLAAVERRLLSRRKRRAIDEMELVLKQFLHRAGARRDQFEIDAISRLLNLLRNPTQQVQPDWEEFAARWLDLIRPIWYQKLQDKRRQKPLLLKDIRSAVIADEVTLLPRILEEFGKGFPAQRPPDERIVACIVGVA